ncbi:hypothetical protein [Amnibacterium kyonggiense]
MSETSTTRPKTSGPGRTLIVFYFIMWIAALARSVFEIVTHFEVAPLAYLLSLFAGIVYLIATIALITPGRRAYLVARTAITIELIGVLVVGTLSVADLSLFPFEGDRSTVWAYFGLEYLLIPLALPILGLLFLRSQRAVFERRG